MNKSDLMQMMDSQVKDLLIAHSTSYITKAKCLLILITRKIEEIF